MTLRAVAAAALVAVFTALSGASARAETVEEFCAPRVLTDYEAPLRALPPVNEPPESGKLPFGPRRLNFRAEPGLGPESPLIIEGHAIKYRLWLEGAALGPKRIGWRIESRLVRVNSIGKRIRVARRKLERIGLLDVASGGKPAPPREIGFAQSPIPGLYRYSLVFRDTAGHPLGRYYDYYRVVPRVVDVRLVTYGAEFRVGDGVSAKVENHGTLGTFYGAGLEIDRLGPSGWERADFEELFGHPNIVPAIGLGTGPGTSSSCMFNSFQVPAGMTPGRYRIVKRVDSGVDPRVHGGEELSLTAEFTVLPPA